MKGLILKDLYTLKKQGKIIIVLAAFYMLYSFIFKNISMLGGMIALLCSMLPMTTIAYDEKCNWDKYALAMPIQRKTMVLSKYILGSSLNIISIIILIPISVAITLYTGEMNIKESVLTLLAIGGIAIVFMSIMLPFLIKFGVEKARMIILLVILLPTAVGYLISKLNFKMPSAETVKILVYLLPFAVVAIFIISILISIQIYEKKDF